MVQAEMRSNDKDSLRAVLAFSAAGLFLTLVALLGRLSAVPAPNSRDFSDRSASSDDDIPIVSISHAIEAAE